MGYTAEQIDEHIDKFTEVYENGKEVNPVPYDTKVTVWCESKTDEGFLCDQTTDEIGFELLVVKRWILESELKELIWAFIFNRLKPTN